MLCLDGVFRFSGFSAFLARGILSEFFLIDLSSRIILFSICSRGRLVFAPEIAIQGGYFWKLRMGVLYRGRHRQNLTRTFSANAFKITPLTFRSRQLISKFFRSRSLFFKNYPYSFLNHYVLRYRTGSELGIRLRPSGYGPDQAYSWTYFDVRK